MGETVNETKAELLERLRKKAQQPRPAKPEPKTETTVIDVNHAAEANAGSKDTPAESNQSTAAEGDGSPKKRGKGSKGKGQFFAIDAETWREVLDLGMNEAVAYLVLATGSGRDQRNTKWSRKAVQKYGGLGGRATADRALANLIRAGKVEKVQGGDKPLYKLILKGQNWIWLPNQIVTSAAYEQSPVSRIRQTRDIEIMRLFIDLYVEHDLPGAGGIDWSTCSEEYTRERIGERAAWVLWGFMGSGERTVKYRSKAAQPHFTRSGKDWDAGDFWDRFRVLEQLGLIETVPHLCDGDAEDGAIMHPISREGGGIEHQLGEAAALAAEAMLEVMDTEAIAKGEAQGKTYPRDNMGPFGYKALGWPIVVPVLSHIRDPHVIGVKRLRYRPKTKPTSIWAGKMIHDGAKWIEGYGAVVARMAEAKSWLSVKVAI